MSQAICGLQPVVIPEGFFDKKTLKKGDMLIYKVDKVNEKRNIITGQCKPAHKQSRTAKPYKIRLKVSSFIFSNV